MKTKEVKLYVQAFKWHHRNTWDIRIDSSAFDSCDSRTVIQISEVTVEVEIPDINEKQLTLEEVKQLREFINKEQANSYMRIKAVEERIQSLLAIEHNR